MLKSIGIENFKAFVKTKRVRLAPITLIYGPNSSGKSSLVQSLLLMRQTIAGQEFGERNDLIMRGAFADLGNFSSVLHQHDSSRIMKLSYEFADNLQNLLFPKSKRLYAANQFSEICLSFQGMRSSRHHLIPTLQSIEFGVKNQYGNDFSFELERPQVTSASDFQIGFDFDIETDLLDEELGNDNSTTTPRHHDAFKISPQSDIKGLIDFLRQSGRKLTQTRLYQTDNQITQNNLSNDEQIMIAISGCRVTKNRWRSVEKTYLPTSVEDGFSRDYSVNIWHETIREILRRNDRNLKHTLGKLTYLGPLRMHPARHYLLNGVPGDSVGATGEQTVQILYHDQATKGSSISLLQRLNEWCEIFKIPYTFKVRNIGNAITGDFIVLYLTDMRTKVEVAPSDVGFGIGQLLPILVEGILVNERSSSSRIICVEQPEIHLHPRLQAAMADFFIETSIMEKQFSDLGRTSKNGVQWILETHSEALMLRLQRKIREGFISPSDVCVLYVDPQGEKGSTIEELRLDENGEFLDLWPDGFFEETYTEMMGGR